MTKATEQVNDTQRMLAREVHIRATLKVALEQSGGPTATGAIVASLATIVEDAADAKALRMLRDAMTALMNRTPREVDAVREWHARRDGHDPEQDAVAIVDLARLVARTAQMFKSPNMLVPPGTAAVVALRTELVEEFGEGIPSLDLLQGWFTKYSKQRAQGCLTLTGVVAHILHEGRLFGARGKNFDRTRKRVDRVLQRHPNPREFETELPIPPRVLSD